MDQFRICRTCSYRNDVGDLQCTGCGADISFVNPTAVVNDDQETTPEADKVMTDASMTSRTPVKERIKATVTMPRLKVVNSRDGHEISIPVGGCILGREGDAEADYFERQSTFVGRKHLRIFLKEGAYYVIDEGSLNRTWLNKQLLEYNHEYSLKFGDYLILADLEFVVSNDE